MKLDERVNAVCQRWQGEAKTRWPSVVRRKTIQDPVHGAIEVDKELVYLLDSVMMQRLRRCSQLGLASQVFPGANHTRFEHSLGVMYLVGRILSRIKDQIELTTNQIMEAKAAALLHDVGHLPFSHVPEPLLQNESSLRKESTRLKIKPSELLSMKIITSEWMREIFDKISKDGNLQLDPENVANLAVGYPPGNAPKLKVLGELSHAEFDADRMDYLMRDAHYTGVPLGTLDAERLIRTATISTSLGDTKHLAVDIKGLHSLESMIVARSIMYSTVYFHHTVRAANQMLLRAIHGLFKTNPLKLLEHDDASLITELRTGPQVNRAWTDHLTSRHIFKPVLMLKTSYLENEGAFMDFLDTLSLDATINHEGAIDQRCDKQGRKCCVVDFPPVEPYSEVEANIVERGQVSFVKQHSKIADAVARDRDLKWRGYVFADPVEVKTVHENALAYFGEMGLKFSEKASVTVGRA